MSGGKAVLALALAISVGILAVIAATLYLDRKVAPPPSQEAVALKPPPIPTKEVVVTSGPLKVGTVLSESDLKTLAVPLHALPPNHVVNPIDLIGRRIARGFDADEPILNDQLVPREMDLELAGMLVDGYRAYSVSVSEAGDVAGFVLPGNRIDIILNSTTSTDQAFSRVLLQDIKVLAVAQDRVVQDRTRPRPAGLVTLEVTPSQAEILDVARTVGTVSFALRAQSDRGTVATLGARQEEFNGSKPVIEVIRGTARTFE